ncbi:hypothetical protein [Flavobacterium sp. '19STA2R22 D10 B1']|uniref:hypothetical protein n=1 Tax=Flavobacterium aerium TaxID=3037261 RepID=UPI00278C18E3|nr:hypothetical protein [Flavobacterium sp. '19STA2R22 D10 B1']
MNSLIINNTTKVILTVILVLTTTFSFSQENVNFWSKVRYGGGLGLGFGSNGYFSGTIAPSAIYEFNEMFAMGIGTQVSYSKEKNYYNSIIYGGSVLALFNPIPEIQLSAELEQLRVNTTYKFLYQTTDEKYNFWNTALFLGAGYRTRNVVIGARYNVLHDKEKTVYSDALMPFVRVYF